MKTLAVILFTLIILPVYSQTVQIESEVYKVTIKGIEFTLYFDRGPATDKFKYTVSAIKEQYKQYTITGFIKEINTYSPALLEYIPNQFYFVSSITRLKDNKHATGVCFRNEKIILVSSLSDGYPITFHHEIFHSFVHSFYTTNIQKELFKNTLNISNTDNLPETIYWDGYYPLGFSSEHGLNNTKKGNIEEDLASLYAQLKLRNADLLTFLKQNPNSILAKKAEFIIEFLQHIDSDLNLNYYTSQFK